jgi:hypothetical protein
MGMEVLENMEAATNEAVNALKSGKFYTDRRDAADALAESAVSAANALRTMCDDPDVDVSKTCHDNINRLRKTLDLPPRHEPVRSQPVQTAAANSDDSGKKPSLDHMLKVAGSSADRMGRPTSEGYEISCKISTGRQHKVTIRTGQKDKSGASMVQVYSVCAPAHQQMFRWALETNSGLLLGALVVIKLGGKDMFVLMNSHLEEGLDPHELEADISYIAETADWIEHQITGGDMY